MKCTSTHTARFSFIWLPLFLVLSLVNCVESFEPEIKKYEDLLVIDGAISNIPGSVYVKLSKTSPYNERNRVLVNAASVTLMDDLDNKIKFLNSANGKYTPPDPDYAGQIGRSYKVTIETADGINCESQLEELKEPVPLDEVKYVFKDGANDTERGLQILIDVKNINNLNAYFYWEYTETWEFEVPLISSYKPEASVCYKSFTPPVFLISSTQDLAQKQILNFPLYFIDNTSNRLYKEYSVVITQHTLNEQTYVYYHDLKELNENRGSLFDSTPLTLIGNLRNLSNPDQPVLGNFQVSGAVTQRIFIKNRDIADKLIVPSGYENCLAQFGGMKTDGRLLDSLMKAGWVIYDRSFNPASNDTILSLTNYQACCDCTKNGSIVKPDFWDNE
jgi:hypothetical protein